MANSSFDSGSDKLPARSVLHQPTDAENNWHPDLSKERPEWRDAHATQKDAPIAVDQNGIYVVKDGDTVYDIARRSLKVQNAATDVTTINQEVSKIVQHNVDAYPGLGNNPHLIHPGDQLRLGISSMNVPPLDQTPAPGAPAAAPDAPAPTPAAAPDAPAPTPAAAPDAPAPIAAPDSAAALPPVPADVPLPAATVGAPAVAPADGSAPVVAGGPPPLVQIAPDAGPAPGVVSGGDTQFYAADPSGPPPGYSMPAPYQGNFGPSYGPQVGGNYTDQEAYRLSLMMANDPHAAANEMRNVIQGLDPGTAGVLVAKTKNDELVGGLGDLQVQVEYNQNGQDSGYRNVTMATPDGIEQIAELQSRQGYGGGNPLGYIAGAIVGDLLWQRNRGINFNDGQYQGWCNREQGRENYWYSNNSQFVQNWQNPNYRSNYQGQNWQSVASNPTVNNTYITNNRYDTRTTNTTVNNTTINETINNTKTVINNPHPRPIAPVTPTQFHRVNGLPPVTPVRVEGTTPARGQRPPGAPTETGQSQQAQEAARERAAAQAQQAQEAAREKAAAQATQQTQEAARAKAAAQAQQAQEAAREKTAAQAQQAQEAAREKAAAQAQQAQEAARERAAAQAQQAQEAAREKAAAQAQQSQEAARERAAAQAQQSQEAARERAAAQAQQAQEAARERAAAQAQQAQAAAREKAATVVIPPQKKN